MSPETHDVRPEQYAMVIREMIRHENEVTNHRVMWMLIGQGFIANAFVTTMKVEALNEAVLLVGGVLVALSAYLMLYKSYQARGYLEFLGQKAKQGGLAEAELPLTGWPRQRVGGWWKGVWASAWIGRPADLLEPWAFLPWLFVFMWMAILFKARVGLSTAMSVGLGAGASAATLAGCSLLLVWLGARNERHP